MPLGIRVPCEEGATIFGVAQGAKIGISTACGAKATCGLCRVKILAGEPYLSPLTATEKKHLGNVYFITKLRLSCQTTVHNGDVTVEIPGVKVKGAP